MSKSSYDSEAINEYSRDNNWIYFGGDKHKTAYDNLGTHYKYFCQISKDYFGYLHYIPHNDRCVCNHVIYQNCYIYNTSLKEFAVIGNCCIKKFNLQGKTCSMCEATHKNRKDNYCNDCRKVIKEQERNKMICSISGCRNKKKYEWSKLCIPCWKKQKREA